MVINGKQAINKPNEGENTLKFQNYHKQLEASFVIYADSEAITEKVHGCAPKNSKSYTETYQKHVDCGYCYKVDMIMSKTDIENFKTADSCHICNQKYIETDIKVRDHCHVTGRYRGSAHNDCNLSYRLTDKVPVVFHNLRGYDSHFIMQQIGKIVKKHSYKNKWGELKEMDINVIPNNMEKYMALMLGSQFKFIDSFQFMSSSLADNLPKTSFKYTKEKFDDKKKFELMTKKGVYLYDYMDSFEKFDETQLPYQRDFYSLLIDEYITDEQYKHAKRVWKKFELKTMRDYHDLYLKSDVILLADIFENFRSTCLEYYKLGPCHYYTSLELSWDSMLKMTKVELELMTDVDMFLFIEKGLRGVSYIANRYRKANNKYITNYDKDMPSKYLMYANIMDANSLYGYGMSQYLPTGEF
ncbi:uncharacterized protein LOC130629953 [Hydractinia symbiolongicarpus]|uniref:uncharacterized protein LOC130629953 n=1 Tax=Hydractinia symbiolongicarpus TaxID=13093 RepID=UPI00254EE9B5|nr:uncharacterized protein LOC130629953 [Hydractinia symbiolongicarpus]